MTVAGVVEMICLSVVCVGIMIGALVAIGYRLLTSTEELEQIAQAKVWRQKRRELNASIESRRPR